MALCMCKHTWPWIASVASIFGTRVKGKHVRVCVLCCRATLLLPCLPSVCVCRTVNTPIAQGQTRMKRHNTYQNNYQYAGVQQPRLRRTWFTPKYGYTRQTIQIPSPLPALSTHPSTVLLSILPLWASYSLTLSPQVPSCSHPALSCLSVSSWPQLSLCLSSSSSHTLKCNCSRWV